MYSEVMNKKLVANKKVKNMIPTKSDLRANYNTSMSQWI